LNPTLVKQVYQRASGVCEYCHLPASCFPLSFHVDHITPRQHGGATELDNLALACLHCNRHKGPNLSGLDQTNGDMVRLFNPRQQLWADHFEWRGSELVGRSGIGRVTVRVLAMNDPDFRGVRETLRREGRLSF